MRIHARQHLPGYIDVDTKKVADVQSLSELLDVPWIARWASDDLVAKNGIVSVRPFYQWSVADPGTDYQTLMAEFDHGDHFWVVAFVTSDEPLPLPTWRETENARLRRERWNRGDTSE